MRQSRRNAAVEDVPQKMSDAVYHGNLDEVKRLITKYGLSYHRDWLDGCAILRQIISFSDYSEHENLVSRTDIAIFLIRAGAKVTIARKNMYMLHETVRGNVRRCSPIVKALLVSGVSASSRNDKGDTPLHCVKTVEVARLLFSRHADSIPDVNATNNAGLTPLHTAAINRNTPIIRFLLENGANIDAVCTTSDPGLGIYRGFTAAHFAAHKDSPSALRLLFREGALVNLNSENGTALRLACDNALTSCYYIFSALVQCLLYGGDINFPDENGKTVVHIIKSMPEDIVSYPDQPKVLAVLGLQVAKLKIAGMYVSEENSRAFEETEFDPEYVVQCENEVSAMKSEKVGDSCVTYFDVLTQSNSRVASYTKNPAVANVLNFEDCTKKFPRYGGMVEARFRRLGRRVKLLDKARVVLSNIFTVLPHICIDLIVDYLNNDSLMKLSDST